MVVVSDYGHGLISKKNAQLICKKSKYLALNAQVNAANTRELAEFQADRERSSQVGGFIAQVAQPFIQVGASALAEWAFS